MSIESEVIAAVQPKIDEAFAKPVPLAPDDVAMIRGLMARVAALEKAVGVLQAALAKG